MLTVEQLKHLKNQLARSNLEFLMDALMPGVYEWNNIIVDMGKENIRDDLIRGLELLILHRKGTME